MINSKEMDYKTEAGKSNILIVDDNSVNRNVVKDLVHVIGYTSVTAKNGLYALSILQEQECDLVLLDICMPEMDGHQVLEYMKNDSRLCHIPVIMISALVTCSPKADPFVKLV